MELISEVDDWQSRRGLRQRNGAGRKKNDPGSEHFVHEHKEYAANERKRKWEEGFLGERRQIGGILKAPQLSLTF